MSNIKLEYNLKTYHLYIHTMFDKRDYQKNYMREYRVKNRDKNSISNRKGATKYYHWNKIKKEFLSIDTNLFRI